MSTCYVHGSIIAHIFFLFYIFKEKFSPVLSNDKVFLLFIYCFSFAIWLCILHYSFTIILFFRTIYFSCKINFVSSTFSFYKYLNIFERVGDLCVNCFFWFSQIFFFTAFLNMNIKMVAKGNRTKTYVFNISQNLSKHKSFDVIITKYTLSVLFTFTV